MKNPTRFILSLLLLGAAYVLFGQAQVAYNDPAGATSKAILLFGGVVIVGVAGGVLVAFSFVPQVAEGIGNMFFQPNEPIEKNPHSSALCAISRGDYAKAVDEYRRVYDKNPDDTLALSEMVRLYCDKLHTPEPAAELLESAIQRDLLPEDAAFLCSRLADVYWTQRNVTGARGLLLQVMETMPGTRHAANASHRLQEIERKLASED